MPRFFLDVLHGRRVCEDPEGQDFIDLDAARAEAVASAQCVVAHGILRNEDVSDRSFLIRDEDEQPVATVPFRDSLPGTLSAGSLSVLAHELNQPLAAASNYLSAAKRLPVVDGSRAMAFVDKAGQQILRAGEIIQRQRDFVSKGKLTRHVTDIRPVLKDALALALIDRSHRDIKVVERVDPGRALCSDRQGPSPAGAGEPDPQRCRSDGGAPAAGDYPGDGAQRAWPG